MFTCDHSHVQTKSTGASCIAHEAVGSTHNDISSSTATDSPNDEPKTFFPMPPTHPSDSCKSGQGREYFNMLIQDLNKDSNTNTRPVCKPLINECNNSMPVASTMGNMKIIEVAANGHFVRLLNISQDMEEDIGGFALQQNINGHPVTAYRFPPRTRVNAGAGLTVWAAAAKVPHNPPKDFLLKESNKFGTSPACTTILCKPNGQAVAWFTPAPGNSKLNNPCKDGGKFTDYEHPLSTSNDTQLNFQPDKGNGETFANGCHFSPPALPMKPKPPVLTLPTRSPWSQSTACPTHPDYSLPRTQSLGSSGGSQCRDTRSQSARPDPIPGNLNSGLNTSNQYRKYSSSKNDKKSSTQSAATSSGQQKYHVPETMLSPVHQKLTATQHLQSMQNLSFQPPMPRPPPVASW
ncbi:LOW QUALITY PROTEIN: lamin tail domain-containing protein 1-like [Mustelus asterias]